MRLILAHLGCQPSEKREERSPFEQLNLGFGQSQ